MVNGGFLMVNGKWLIVNDNLLMIMNARHNFYIGMNPHIVCFFRRDESLR